MRAPLPTARLKRSRSWVAVGLLTAGAVVAGALPAWAASPTTPTSLQWQRSATYTPSVSAVVSDPDGGTVNALFYVRTPGSSTWDIVNGTQVAVTSGQRASLPLPAPLAAGQPVEWTVKACDASTCSATATVRTDAPVPALASGERVGATRLKFAAGDHVAASVDVGTGNLLVQTTDLVLPGIAGDVPLGMAYNSAAYSSGLIQSSTSSKAGWNWTQRLGWGVQLSPISDGTVWYQGPGGVLGTFTPSGTVGSTTSYTAPAGFKADLVKTGTSGWTLTDHDTGSKMTFNGAGALLKVEDRNANATTLTYAAGSSSASSNDVPTTITSTRGTSAARTATITLNSGGKVASITQGTGATARSVSYTYDTSGRLATVTDALLRETTFGYNDGVLTSVTAPGGVVTQFGYDSNVRVTSITQVNPSTGSPGDSVTRLAYPSASQTVLKTPTQTGTITAAPNTTYTLTSDKSGRVASVVDAQGRTQASTYTANFDTLTGTAGTAGVGAGASTWTATYGANGGESKTKMTSPTGAAQTYGYANTAAATKNLATTSSDSASNTSAYTYNGAGNPLTAADAKQGAASQQNAVTRNSDGTVATATAAGLTAGAASSTSYGYDTDHQLTSITAPTSSSLGARAFTWDTYGRLATASNGRGVTSTYTYDKNDRVTGLDYSGTSANPDIAYTYDTAGRVAARADASGTTTYTYDAMSRLTKRVNTADTTGSTVGTGGSESYAYDKSSNLTSVTDGRGTLTYAYDSANALVSMADPSDATGRATRFTLDSNGRRTDTWMDATALSGSPAATTSFSAHSHTDYDASGRVKNVWAERSNGTGGAATKVVDQSYCYAAGATAPACSTAASSDRAIVRWMKDNVTGVVTTYAYDTADRLTQAAATAGTKRDSTAIPATTYDFAYDARGNRTTSTTTTGGTPNSVTRTYNAGNQTTTSGFSYDGAGNQTTDPVNGTLAYTAGDQMTSVTKGGSSPATYNYTYSGTGSNELVSQTTPTGSYAYQYGAANAAGLPRLEQVRYSGTSAGAGTASVGNDSGGSPVTLTLANGQRGLYVYDALGSPIGLIGADNYSYMAQTYKPYGALNYEDNTGGYAPAQLAQIFTGGTWDRTTGWVKNGTRYYVPDEGHWTQQDTINAPLDALNANRYLYVNGNASNYIDPLGYFSFLAFAGGCAEFAGGVIASGAVFAGAVLGPEGPTLVAGAACVVGGVASGIYLD